MTLKQKMILLTNLLDVGTHAGKNGNVWKMKIYVSIRLQLFYFFFNSFDFRSDWCLGGGTG